jgi:hypothetical protein
MLAEYLADTQNLLNDCGQQFFREQTLTSYINRGRRRIAMASGCVRVIPPGVQTVANQERYHFRDWMPLVQTTPGVREIYLARSLAVAIGPGDGAWKPMWNRIPWTDFQARFRIWNRGWIGTISSPGFWSQHAFGTIGSIYLAPIPSLAQPMDVDCACLPFPLETDEDPECIPMPWTDAVPFYAATMCLLQQQRQQDAAMLLQIFSAELPFAASVVAPTLIQAPYGAALRAT